MILICGHCIYLITNENSQPFENRTEGSYQIVVQCPNCKELNVVFQNRKAKVI